MSEVPEHYLIERLLEVFATDERVGELGLEVAVAAGAIHIHGKVHSTDRRDAISAVATELAGGVEIRNEVRVLEPSIPPHAPEILE